MKKYGSVILFVLAIILAVSSFFLFRVLLSGKASNYTSEIAAAVLGSLLTIIITAIMLNKQTEVDMRKDRTSTLLANKLEVYGDLMRELKEMLSKGSIDRRDVVAIQILNQRIAFIASHEVLKAFQDFASSFASAAKDGNLVDAETDALLDKAGTLSVKIRKDLLSEEELHEFNETEFQALVNTNVKSLSSSKITQDGFLGLCNDVETPYFSAVLDHLQRNAVFYTMGTKGLSIKNKDGNAIVWCFPSSAKRNIEILKDNLNPDQLDWVTSFLKSKGIAESKFQSAKISIKSDELIAADLCELIDHIS